MVIKRTGFTMPKTDVEDTPSAPKATKGTGNAAGLSQRDIYMAAQAATKSALESPLLAELARAKPESELPALVKQYAGVGLQSVIELTAKYGGND